MREDIDEALAAFPKNRIGNAACRQFATDLLLTGKAYSPCGEIVELLPPPEEEQPAEEEHCPEVEPPLPLVACRTCKYWEGDRNRLDIWGLCTVNEEAVSTQSQFCCFMREPLNE